MRGLCHFNSLSFMVLCPSDFYCLIKLYSTLRDQLYDTLGSSNQPAGLMADVNLSRRRDIRARSIYLFIIHERSIYPRDNH